MASEVSLSKNLFYINFRSRVFEPYLFVYQYNCLELQTLSSLFFFYYFTFQIGRAASLHVRVINGTLWLL